MTKTITKRYEIEHGLEKIVMNRGSKREFHYFIPQKKYEEQVAIAKELLGSDFEGYLSLEERMEAQGVLDKTNYFRNTVPKRTKRRVEEIKAAGFPPIFDSGIENPLENSTYPILDVLIQLPSGKLFERYRRQDYLKSDTKHFASSREDILAFRTLAYDGSRLSTHVIRDILDYFGQKDFGETETRTILKADHIILKYLEASLRGVEPQEREYTKFDSSQPIDFIGKRFWHVQYTPEDRENIAREYKRRLESREIKKNYEHFRRMKALFPEIIGLKESEIEVARNRSKMKEHKSQGDYRSMPQVVLVDHRYGTEYIDALRDHVMVECERVVADEPTGIFQPLKDMHQEFKIPTGLLYLEQFRDVVTAKRVDVLQRMDDQSFEDYFQVHHRTASIGHRQLTNENLIDQQFRSLLLNRYAQLNEVRKK